MPNLRCAVEGPARTPAIAARLGLDLNPLDPADPETARWLQCLVWPEHTDRAARLSAALACAAGHPVEIIQGSVPADVPAAISRLRAAAPDATPVVTHSAVAAYLSSQDRVRFAEVCRDAVRRLGLEGAQVCSDLGCEVPDGVVPGTFLLTLDDEVLAIADPHGRSLRWL